MALRIDHRLTAQKLVPKIERLFDLSAQKILSLEKTWEPAPRHAGCHGEGQIHLARLDGVDARVPVRLGVAPV